ncbi:hypothetical protein ALC56_14247 [Trachymyrmex septentrionalis]|uniref:Uncharacterized protein n=1 Tax=Trachymyrmex septentrionalis TaxID=34720 RepID=A0A195ET81_9HYME|nr:hypothetical protein ALC56_14247 [Trachymyrmex septentrionalis]
MRSAGRWNLVGYGKSNLPDLSFSHLFCDTLTFVGEPTYEFRHTNMPFPTSLTNGFEFTLFCGSLAKLQRAMLNVDAINVTRLVMRTPASNRDNERPFARGGVCLSILLDIPYNIGIRVRATFDFSRTPISITGSPSVENGGLPQY